MRHQSTVEKYRKAKLDALRAMTPYERRVLLALQGMERRETPVKVTVRRPTLFVYGKPVGAL